MENFTVVGRTLLKRVPYKHFFTGTEFEKVLNSRLIPFLAHRILISYKNSKILFTSTTNIYTNTVNLAFAALFFMHFRTRRPTKCPKLRRCFERELEAIYLGHVMVLGGQASARTPPHRAFLSKPTPSTLLAVPVVPWIPSSVRSHISRRLAARVLPELNFVLLKDPLLRRYREDGVVVPRECTTRSLLRWYPLVAREEDRLITHYQFINGRRSLDSIFRNGR